MTDDVAHDTTERRRDPALDEHDRRVDEHDRHVDDDVAGARSSAEEQAMVDQAQTDARTADPARRDDAVVTDDRVATGDGVAADTRRDDVAAAEGTAADGTTAGERSIDRDPTSERTGTDAGPGTTTEWSDGLLSGEDRGGYQQRWDDIQVRFIDEPRESVREADDLVSEVTTRISERFSGARRDMEQRWDGGNEPTTEELRQAVQRYRDFFQRLVAQ